MQKHHGLLHIPDTASDETSLPAWYAASEVDVVLKRQAAAAIAGMNAATAISRGQVQQAHRLRAESSPEMLESERQANAILTARIAELEKALRELLDADRDFLGSDNQCVYCGSNMHRHDDGSLRDAVFHKPECVISQANKALMEKCSQ